MGVRTQKCRHSGRTLRTRAWRVAPCRRPAAPFKKIHTKCVPSQLILRMKNSGSEESLAVDAARFRVRHFPPVGSAGVTYPSPYIKPPPFSSAPDLSSLSVQGQCWCPRTKELPAHRTRGETDVIRRQPSASSMTPNGEFLKIRKNRPQRHQRHLNRLVKSVK